MLNSNFDLQAHWQLDKPYTMAPINQGTNSRVYRVKTATGQNFILRLHRLANVARLRYEAQVTQALQEANLPFHIPSPILTKTGDIFVDHHPADEAFLVTLWPFIRGTSPDRKLESQAQTGGAALALLHLALARVNVPITAEAGPIGTYGDVLQIYPRLGDFEGALAPLAIPSAKLDKLLALYQHLQEHIPKLYQTLPQQLIHADYGPANLLMQGDKVTAVLDFEFTTPDIRLLDI